MTVAIATILNDGAPMDPEYRLFSVDIGKEVNRIPDARIVLLDGNPAERSFPTSDAAFFEPGKEIEIKMRYEGDEDATLFKGLVIRHAIEADIAGSTLTVELKDPSVKLVQPRRSQVFREKTDGDIITQLVQDAGLEAGDIADTKPTHPEIVQYKATDWDFILSRADVLGLMVVADDGVISTKPMKLEGSPAHTFEYGLTEIYDMELAVDASDQHSAVIGVAWDIQNQTATEPNEANPLELSQGNLDPGAIAETIGFAQPALSHPVPVDPDELQAWTDARMARSRLAMIRGRIATRGFADIKPMDLVELDGMGERFNGQALVTGIRHQLSHQGWQTDIQLGLTPELFCYRDRILEAPSAGLLPAVSGLQIGVVDQFEEDPAGEYRVKVIVPAIDATEGAVFARLATPDAGAGRGYLFRPEPGDEVVVGFLNSDPRQAVILGSMFSSANAPPEAVGEPEEANPKKGIVSAKGTAISFLDEDKAKISIETAAGNNIAIDDDGEAIALSDQHGNTITMNKDGITLKSHADFKVEASGNVEIKGSAVDVQ